VKQLFTVGMVFLTLSLLTALALSDNDASPQSGILPVHEFHVDAEIECEACHGAAWTAEILVGLMPDHDTCVDCHDVDDTDECGVCHVDGEDPSGIVRASTGIAKFPHLLHVGEEDESCVTCHQLQDSGKMNQLGHTDCRSCHQVASNFLDCSMCHGEGDPIRLDSHTPQYMALHALEASWDDQQCRSCHTQADCQDCHNGDNVRPRVHELNYAFSHSIDARSFEFMCSTCHADPDYCVSCHAAERIYPENHSRADWIPSRHSVEASYNMESCIACHDAGQEDPVCANCHGGR